jgi:hypothetical protein
MDLEAYLNPHGCMYIVMVSMDRRMICDKCRILMQIRFNYEGWMGYTFESLSVTKTKVSKSYYNKL